MLLVHHADHFFAPYLQGGAVGNGRGRGQTQPHRTCERFFTHKVALGEERDGGFLSGLRNDGEFCTARLEIEDRIGRVPLRKKGLLGYQVNYSSPEAGARKERRGIERDRKREIQRKKVD